MNRVLANRDDFWVAAGFLALLALAALLLWPGIYGPFLFDDLPNFANLRDIDGHFTRSSVGVYLSLFTGTPGRPLAALSFLLNDYSWPSEPLGFKLTNLWIHLLNGVLVFGTARSLVRAAFAADAKLQRQASHAALACAAIWLLSPIQISAVFLTVQRMAELAGTFMFAGLWGYLAIGMRARNGWHGFLALAVLGLGTILALLCKENGILLPLLVLVLHATILRTAVSRLPVGANRWLRYGVGITVIALIAAFAYRWKSLTGYGARDFTMWERVLSQGRAIMDYVGLIVAPRLSASSLYNDDFVVSRSLFNPVTTAPAFFLVISGLAAAIASRKRWPLAAFAVLWFFAAHALESTVFPVELYFEHRNYVPLFGPAFAISVAAFRIEGKLRRLVLAGLAAWLLLAATILHLQAQVWGDEGKLATFWHLEHPDSLRAQQQYAMYLVSVGRTWEAHDTLARAASRDVSPVDSGLQALGIKCAAGRPIGPEEVRQAESLLRTAALSPGTAAMLARLRLAVQAGRCPDAIPPQRWLRFTDAAIANPRGRGTIRMLMMERAELFLAANQLDAAVHEMDRAYSGRKRNPRIAFYAAARLAAAGRYDEARAWARRPLDQPWTWKNWLAQTDLQARQLINAIDGAQRDEVASSHDSKE